MVAYRYSRWDGSQEGFALDADDLMDRLSEHLMRTGDLTSALRALMKGNRTDADDIVRRAVNRTLRFSDDLTNERYGLLGPRESTRRHS